MRPDTPHPATLRAKFVLQPPFHTYQAAGGVVLDDNNRVLLLERDLLRDGVVQHEIRLPKGHIEAGETPAQAALREVCEESGFCRLEIVADLGQNTIEFTRAGGITQRREHYFLMRLRTPQRQPPQPTSPTADEALFRPLWAADLIVAETLLTYDSEKHFVRQARQKCMSGYRTLTNASDPRQ
jgi:8-oxo-dGTP pyrophosphatase MutT (NUDIX family)